MKYLGTYETGSNNPPYTPEFQQILDQILLPQAIGIPYEILLGAGGDMVRVETVMYMSSEPLAIGFSNLNKSGLESPKMALKGVVQSIAGRILPMYQQIPSSTVKRVFWAFPTHFLPRVGNTEILIPDLSTIMKIVGVDQNFFYKVKDVLGIYRPSNVGTEFPCPEFFLTYEEL